MEIIAIEQGIAIDYLLRYYSNKGDAELLTAMYLEDRLGESILGFDMRYNGMPHATIPTRIMDAIISELVSPILRITNSVNAPMGGQRGNLTLKISGGSVWAEVIYGT